MGNLRHYHLSKNVRHHRENLRHDYLGRNVRHRRGNLRHNDLGGNIRHRKGNLRHDHLGGNIRHLSAHTQGRRWLTSRNTGYKATVLMTVAIRCKGRR